MAKTPREEEEQENLEVNTSEDLPTVKGLTQTAQDTEPQFAKLYDQLMRRETSTSQDLISQSINTLQRAVEVEPNPLLQARLAVMLSMLREGPMA